MLTEISFFGGLVVSVFSFIIVFLTLIVIASIIKGITFLSNDEKEEIKINKKDKTEKLTKELNVTDEVIDDELIAVIAAAISTSISINNSSIHIKNIKRDPQITSLWKEVGNKERLLSKL